MKSLTWDYFDKAADNLTCKCKECGITITCGDGSPTNANHHLQRKHPNIYEEMEKKKNAIKPSVPPKNKAQTKLSAFVKHDYYNKNSDRQLLLEEKTANMIALDLQPFSVVNQPGFRGLVSALDPRFKLPSREAFSRTIIPKLYEKERLKLKELFAAVNYNGLSLTSDIWTARNQDAYIDVTAHFITNFKIESKLLDTIYFPERHTADNILDKLDTVLDFYQLNLKETKVYIITDNATNYMSAFRRVSTLITPIPCFAHTLQLAINDSLKEVPGLKANLKLGDEIVAFYRRSVVGFQNLKSNQSKMGLRERKLIPSVPTRWNSEYDKEKRLIENMKPLMISMVECKITSSRTIEQWEEMKELINILEPFKKATEVLSGESYPTLSSVIPILHGIITFLDRLDENLHSASGHLLVTFLKSNLAIRFPDNLASSEPHILSKIIDPRFKDVLLDEEKTLLAKTKLLSFWKSLNKNAGEVFVVDRGAPETSQNEDALWGAFENAVQKKKARMDMDNSSAEDNFLRELETFLKEPVINRQDCPIQFFEQNGNKFPSLIQCAKILLSIPATAAPSERVWSDGGNTVTSARESLLPDTFRMLMFIRSNRK